MPALQACCLRHTFVLKVHVAHVRNWSVNERQRDHEKRETARLATALPCCCGAMLIARRWYTASRSGHHMLDRPGTTSSEETSSLSDDSAGRTTRAASREHKRSSWSTATLTERVELGQVQHRLDLKIKEHCCQKGSWANRERNGPLVRHDFTRNTIKMHSALGTQSQQSPRSRCTQGQLLSLSAEDQRFCAPQTRQARFVPLRRVRSGC